MQNMQNTEEARVSLRGQELVDAILERAKETNFGCGEAERSLKLSDTFANDNNEAVAMALISAFHSKYDLISIMQATLDVLHSQK